MEDGWSQRRVQARVGEPRLIVAAAIIVLLLDGDQITCNNKKDGRWIVEDAGW
jgi:hypothetical protein